MNEPTLVPSLAAVLLAGWLMVQAGVGKKMLDWRPRPLRCQACRGVLHRCSCHRG